MKLSIPFATLVSAASFMGGADALRVPDFQQVFDLGHGAIDQAIKFGQDALSAYGSGPLLQTIASYLNLDLNTLTPEMHSVWDELVTKFPLTISKMQLKLSVPKGRKFRKASFDFHVADTKFPDHKLRVKSTPADLGVDTVKQYSGYLDVEDEDKHFFYWFFESRNDPKNDPIILWLNGGPGCSSMTGLFFELGPASVGEKLKPINNPYSWNNNASVIFLDQPVNVGYSYSSSSVSNTVAAAKDVYAFLELFFKQFPEYNKKQDFHIAGESYAGHYIPQFASEILSHKDRSFELSSVLIGNGLTDPLVQYEYYQPMACGKGGYPSVLDPEECDAMENLLPRCLSLIESCYESGSIWSCVPATIYCNNGQLLPYQRTGRNVYDIRGMCEDSNLCYKDLKYIDQYLNQDFVKERLGAEVDSFESCNFDVNKNFMLAGDWMKPYQKNVVDLLESGLPVLIYAGDKDFICNWLGNQGWTDRLQWSGSDGFAVTPVKDWKLGKKTIGEVKNYKNLTFLRIFAGGHMVPMDQPENSLDMVNRWIAGDCKF
ncbi:carboxypeptidase C [Scheffersomyces spartinae]|uniref:Carboxypeptidase n=1 Tax=Scheffersomyces spartinae TaxID=45513 RepID=A0A9P7VBD3_9ASCO|nr:carboxypeptidase C [Scheffersomyces spartinae]KAG7194951.1 carboxypeptidase C [Scheffersomyces spartinae]